MRGRMARRRVKGLEARAVLFDGTTTTMDSTIPYHITIYERPCNTAKVTVEGHDDGHHRVGKVILSQEDTHALNLLHINRRG